jgi:hypothetical protein
METSQQLISSIPGSMFTCKVKNTDHTLIRCGGHSHNFRIQQEVTKGNKGSRIGSTEKCYRLSKRWHSFFAKYNTGDSCTPTHCDSITELIHDGSNPLCDEYQENWCTIQVVEQNSCALLTVFLPP